MATKTLKTPTEKRKVPRGVAGAAAARKLSDFGQLGFGMDVVKVRPTTPLVELTYERGKTFHFHKDILLPDQFNWNETPAGRMHEGNFSGIMTTARDYQRTLSVRVLGGAPVEGIEFSGEASAANERFTRVSERTVRMLIEKLASYEFLTGTLDRTYFQKALTDEVRRAITEAGTDPEAIQRFFSLYGTHVATRAAVGGHMHLETRLQVTVDVNQEVTKNDIDVSAEAKAEQQAHIKGTIGFHDRYEKNSKVFIENSSTDYQLLGGDVTAKDVETWRKSLTESEIPTSGNVSPVYRVSRHGMVAYLRSDGNQYLGLVSPQFDPIYEVLPLSPEQKAAWKEAFKPYFGNVSPFDDTPQRFVVDKLGSPIREGDQATFEMPGWGRWFEDQVAFEALPMATAVVQVKTNSAFDDVWTETKLFAGQATQVRDRTSYWGDRYLVRVVSINGDPDGVVYARIRELAW